jgi:hypothetical protein
MSFTAPSLVVGDRTPASSFASFRGSERITLATDPPIEFDAARCEETVNRLYYLTAARHRDRVNPRRS